MTLQEKASSISAAFKHLPRAEKICKFLADFNFDVINLNSPTKLKLYKIIDKLIDVFAECDSHVGSTNVVFH